MSNMRAEAPTAGVRPAVRAALAILALLAWLLIAPAARAVLVEQTFNYTGGEQSLTIPAAVTSIYVRAFGGNGAHAFTFGEGAVVEGELPVTAGQTLYVEVGGNGEGKAGEGESPYSAGGFNGGGSGAGGGGGASDVRTRPRALGLAPDDRLIVAGGGGGGGNAFNGHGGYGGQAGQPGGSITFPDGSFSEGGGAGTQSAGGTGGAGTCASGDAGSLGVGGNGDTQRQFGGGGGGGYYGGGGGAGGAPGCVKQAEQFGAGGGGGSSLVPPGGRVSIAGGWPRVVISYVDPLPVVRTLPASSVMPTMATLNAVVDPEGLEVSECRLEYGPTPSYGSSAPCVPSPGSGYEEVHVSAAIIGLAPSTTYHFRISATNAAGTSKGEDQTFSTLAALPTPHWDRNGAKIALGEKFGTIGWGTLTLQFGAGNITCRTAQAANVENSKGAARQETVLLATWECKAVGGKCAGNEPRLTARGLPWTAMALEEGEAGAELFREEAAGIELDSECYVGGKLTESLAFKTGPVLGYTGTWTPKWQNGTSATKPSEIVFAPSQQTGFLYAESEGKALEGVLKGKLKLVGYLDNATVPLITLEP